MRRVATGGVFLLGFLMVAQLVLRSDLELSREARAAEEAAHAKPVEEDMHEFMEYVFEPPYKRLKGALAAPPADNAAWKGIKSDSLILAEAGNLLLGRTSADSQEEWNRHAESVRAQGAVLYAAAKKKDAAEARRSWEVLLQSCNACHEQFAGGEHILAP